MNSGISASFQAGSETRLWLDRCSAYRATRAVTPRPHIDAMTDREAAWDAAHEALPVPVEEEER
jgi:hypothetical protein